MKVNIGDYIGYVGPYQIAEKLLFWLEKSDPKIRIIGKKLSNNLLLKLICDWIYQKRKRKIEVKFNNYDFYSLDHTLALIILPALQKMKKYGNFFVSDDDVPQEILLNISSLDENSKTEFKFNWLMSELIWAFEQIVNDKMLPKEEELKINKNLILFGKYYRHLWT